MWRMALAAALGPLPEPGPKAPVHLSGCPEHLGQTQGMARKQTWMRGSRRVWTGDRERVVRARQVGMLQLRLTTAMRGMTSAASGAPGRAGVGADWAERRVEAALGSGPGRARSCRATTR